ncbi:hypothetical protein AAZX31_10G119400 [Glycine max]
MKLQKMTLGQKHILAAMILVLLFSVGMSKQYCPGTCTQYPICNATCVEKFHYQIGRCVHVPPNNYFCCCAMYSNKLGEFN